LTRCSESTLFHEITDSKSKLTAWTGKPILDFAYPNGSYSQREIEHLKIAGYRMAFTTEPGFITQHNMKNIYALPRFDVLEDVSYRENICRMSGAWFLRKTKGKVNSWE
jgi:peptidoglycan/xylan/chitin deacetylase (PgdA/CDA1 family)